MIVVLAMLLCAIGSGCSGNHEQNDPYTIDNTEFEYEAPAPYYDEKDQK